MTYRIERKKWILYRHTNNLDIIKIVALNLKHFSKSSLSKSDRLKLLKKMGELNYHKARNPNLPLDSINHRINTLAYYMFGHKDKIHNEDRFLFSPLGNLFLKHIEDEEKISKIFLTMLWAIQFQHPHGGTDKDFQLYPFRLIFKLLVDTRLNNMLHAYEVAYLVVFIKSINARKYEALVKQILDMRTWSDEKIASYFKKDEHVYVNAIYEWDYYVSKLLKSAGIIKIKEGKVIDTLVHGKSTKRKLTKNVAKLSQSIESYCATLAEKFKYDEAPLRLDDPERLRIDVIKEIYNFYPEILLEEINEQNYDLKLELLNLPRSIDEYSNNPEGTTSDLFEDILVDGFNMFINVKAKKISGPGNTDIECLYITKDKKFAVDAKSTKNKLSSLSAGRLAKHRLKIGGKYTIVITPRYVPAVLSDIVSTPIVIIRASTFSEYLYNNINNEIREIDYSDFDKIISNNLGTDVSKHISDLTLEEFSIKS